ncbi:hypothetical protein BGW38_003562 [Lunasporangiospora selenospora]|uniref:Defect at low temperature protein 1 n=1 Tax=Lunasporangiospora selenospora TaxID=979761 RepID=A0A9P6KCL6_9FUNG|nr:hypothetical protein BGW38_003562 [Lunasporangiospora selenospora]
MPLTRSSCFYVSSLFFLVAVTGICIFASAYDVIFQILHPANQGDVPNYKNLAVFGGSYVLLGLLATIFGFSRYVTVKLAKQAIPKTFMPITEEDLPKKVYEFVQFELDRVALLTKKATPTLEDGAQPGWGRPGNTDGVIKDEYTWDLLQRLLEELTRTQLIRLSFLSPRVLRTGSSLHGTHFKTFMASTPRFIERAAMAHSPDLARPPFMSISAYIHMLIEQGLITADIGLEYIAGYELARFGPLTKRDAVGGDNMAMGGAGRPGGHSMSPTIMAGHSQLQPSLSGQHSVQPSQYQYGYHHPTQPSYHQHRNSQYSSSRHTRQETSTLSIGGVSSVLRTTMYNYAPGLHGIGSIGPGGTIHSLGGGAPASVGGGGGVVGIGGGGYAGVSGDTIEEEDYIRFMKALSWILQELGWNQDDEEALKEEMDQQEEEGGTH